MGRRKVVAKKGAVQFQDFALVQFYSHVFPRSREDGREKHTHPHVPGCGYVTLSQSYALVPACRLLCPAFLTPNFYFGAGAMSRGDKRSKVLGDVVDGVLDPGGDRPNMFWTMSILPFIRSDTKTR
jgi:hypothetical protein